MLVNYKENAHAYVKECQDHFLAVGFSVDIPESSYAIVKVSRIINMQEFKWSVIN